MSEAEKETVLKLIHPVEEIRVRAFGGLDRLVQEPVEMDFRVSSQIFNF
jgi:hypothetical protein